jgi:hypothetical protein
MGIMVGVSAECSCDDDDDDGKTTASNDTKWFWRIKGENKIPASSSQQLITKSIISSLLSASG